MRRIEPAYPDLFPITHVQRPGYLPGAKVSLDPIKLGIVWEDAPRRILPAEGSVPREAIRAMSFARVARERGDVLQRVLERVIDLDRLVRAVPEAVPVLQPH